MDKIEIFGEPGILNGKGVPDPGNGGRHLNLQVASLDNKNSSKPSTTISICSKRNIKQPSIPRSACHP